MNDLLKEYLWILFWYIVPCFIAGLIVLFIRFVIKPKDYIYRKILHICAVSTVFAFILPASTWWISLLAILTILILINITLLIIERFPFYKYLFIDKSHHEILLMINAYYLIMMVLVAILFGIRGESNKYLVIVAILSWGLGDAFAALIGISFGKHKINLPLVDPQKTYEGSLAMFIVILITSTITLLIFMNYPIWKMIIIPITLAITLTITEAISKKGLDTLTCPTMALIILFLFSL